MSLTFFVAGDPKSKGSKQAFVVSGRAIVTEGKSSKAWEAAVRARVASMDVQRMTGPVVVTLEFFLPMPASRVPKPKSKDYWKRSPVPDTKPDIDKLARAVLDALSKVVYEDDARIVNLQVMKRYSATQPGVEIDVRELPWEH